MDVTLHIPDWVLFALKLAAVVAAWESFKRLWRWLGKLDVPVYGFGPWR